MFGNCALTFSQLLWNVLHNKHPLYTPPISTRIPPERYTPAEMYREYVDEVYSQSPSGCWGPIHTHSYSPSAGGMWTGTTSWLGTGGSYGTSGRAGTSGQPGRPPLPFVFLDLDSNMVMRYNRETEDVSPADLEDINGLGYIPTYSMREMGWKKRIPQPPIPDELFKLEEV
jgi:hypothetical protein